MKFIKEHGDACLQVAQHLGRDCHSAYEVIRSIGLSNSVEEKLARFLVEWSAGGTGDERRAAGKAGTDP